MENPKMVAIYARVSSDRQDVDLSISAQLKAIREYARNNSYEVVREFVDEAETGRTTARPAFREMVSLSRHPQKPFDVILVWKYSRFARSREDSIVYKAMLRKSGVHVISINEPFDDTPTGRLLEAIIESLDEFYSDNLGEEVTRGMRESASRGFYLSCRPPYGYKKVRCKDGEKERTKLEIDPVQAGIVSSMFKDALNGKGLTEITKELNRTGIASPRGKSWGKTSIRIILSNEIYTGTLVWGRQSKRGLDPVRAESACPAIVSRKTFDTAQALIRERAPKLTHPKRLSSRFLLSGYIFCGHCGKAMIGQDAKSGKFSYYVCGTLNKKGAGSCPSHYFNSRALEETVVKVIRENILTEEHLTRLVEMVNEEMDSSSREHRGELEAILEEIADTNRRLDRLYDAVETGSIPLADLAPRIHDLRLRSEKLKERKIQVTGMLSDRKVELASPKIVKSYVKDMRQILEKSELTGKRAFLRGFIKKINVINRQGIINYFLPINGVLEERTGVLPIVQYGGRYWT